MKPEFWQRVEDLYHAALRLDPAARPSFVEQACAGDEDLRREVASLLSYDDRAAGFMNNPVMRIDPAQTPANEVVAGDSGQDHPSLMPPRIGSYEMLESIGKGGMGEVYLALDRRLGRKVAIKFLPDGGDGEEERRVRFDG